MPTSAADWRSESATGEHPSMCQVLERHGPCQVQLRHMTQRRVFVCPCLAKPCRVHVSRCRNAWKIQEVADFVNCQLVVPFGHRLQCGIGATCTTQIVFFNSLHHGGCCLLLNFLQLSSTMQGCVVRSWTAKTAKTM